MRFRAPVAELYEQDFDEACRRLAEVCAPFAPDVVIGIATGGTHVCDAMVGYLPSAPTVAILTIQRPATSAKHALGLSRALTSLPRPLADVLRWLEVEYREATLRKIAPADLEQRALAVADRSEIGGSAAPLHVLIVDDSVDSGRTLQLAMLAVAHAYPGAVIRTAVLASTWRRPPVIPDFCLHERTLLRLPWSLDARTLA